MKQSGFFPISVLILSVLLICDARGWAVTVEQLVAGAKKEGKLDLYGPSVLGPAGTQALGDALNKMYGLNITANYHSAGNMAQDAGKIVGLAVAGVQPEWDVMIMTDAHHATLGLRKLHEATDYKKLGIDPRIIHYGNGSISFANQFVLPAYNHKILPAKDVPKSWEDLLDPKWKGGKLGMSTATHHLARLAAGPWGEEKTTRYVKALAQQGLSLGRLGELMSRLQLGEILVAVTMTTDFLRSYRAKQAAAPIVQAEGIAPIIAPAMQAGVVKGARHPNTGHLFTVFLTTLRGQEVYEKYGGLSSSLIPGTTAYKYAQGKQLLYMSDKDADRVDGLARDYGRILGFGN
ncbi:MAG: extracellular solute-binding protein [Deltaproteobacteria bacterium]|nr:extracellular solute-binding protein [Deltaproteobacteria bacterium]